MTARIVPATADRWADLVEVFEGCGYGRKCWCAYWYLPRAQFKAGWGEANRAPLERLAREGTQPGLIAYFEAMPAAWVSVAPRRNFDRLNRSRNFAPVDDADVWAVNCFIVGKPFRRQDWCRGSLRQRPSLQSPGARPVSRFIPSSRGRT